ncbi:acyl carrier protein [Oxalobacteraceae bacterium GrIS 1.11]
MSDILVQLQAIFRDIFDNDTLTITRESNAGQIEDWDSLAHINLVSAIEQEFHIKFALGELQAMKDVGEMIDLMEKKLAR